MNDTEVPVKAAAPLPTYLVVPWLGRHAPAYVPAPLRTLVRHNATPRIGELEYTTGHIVRFLAGVLCVGALGLLLTWSLIGVLLFAVVGAGLSATFYLYLAAEQQLRAWDSALGKALADDAQVAPYTLPVQGFRFNDDSSVSALISMNGHLVAVRFGPGKYQWKEGATAELEPLWYEAPDSRDSGAMPGFRTLAEWWQIYRHPNRGLMYVPWGVVTLRCPDPANPPIWS